MKILESGEMLIVSENEKQVYEIEKIAIRKEGVNKNILD
jgi:hypothetical protein